MFKKEETKSVNVGFRSGWVELGGLGAQFKNNKRKERKKKKIKKMKPEVDCWDKEIKFEEKRTSIVSGIK